MSELSDDDILELFEVDPNIVDGYERATVAYIAGFRRAENQKCSKLQEDVRKAKKLLDVECQR